jgi:hypothetical protein
LEANVTEILNHPVYFTELEDGTFLALSIQRPWFCVSGETLDLARAKAQRALALYESRKPTIKPYRQEKTITPFAPVRVENLRAEALDA